MLSALITRADNVFSNAQWIGATTNQDDSLADRSIWLQHVLKCRKGIKKAQLMICGLGAYEFYIDGKKFGEDLMAPAWSDYRKSIFYNTYDVTSVLSAGSHSIEVLLGNGFFHERGRRYHKLKTNFGPSTLLFYLDIEYTNGKHDILKSDKTWKWKRSQIVYNSIYGGEDHDATFIDRWHPVVVQKSPQGKLYPQLSYPIRIYKKYPIAKHLSAHVFDMGQNLAGFPRFSIQGKAGQKVKIILGETLKNDGSVSQKSIGSPHYYLYTLSGKGIELFQPHFTYYGYQYIQIEGAVLKGDANPNNLPVIDKLESCFISNSAPKIGSFACSNPLFNRTYAIIDAAIRSNWQHVWTDCPHREKLGWLEQDWLNGQGLVDNYDCKSMLEQTQHVIADALHANGSMPEIAPEYIRFEGSWAPPFQESPEWGGALVALPVLYLHRYGDDSLLKKYQPHIRKYVDYLATRDSAYILNIGLGDWYDYNGEKAGFAKNTPVALVSTAHYYLWTKLAGLEQRADSIRQAFIRNFDLKSQAALAIALDLNLYPEGKKQDLLDKLLEDIHQHGDRLTTGDIGTPYLFRVLINNHQQDLLYTMLNHDQEPGYGFQLKMGMTTLTEQWDPRKGASRNHFMLAHINNHLIHDMVGIQVKRDTVVISPKPAGNLTWAKGSTMANGGKIAVDWTIKGNVFQVNIHSEGKNKIKIDYDEINRFCAQRHLRFQYQLVGAE